MASDLKETTDVKPIKLRNWSGHDDDPVVRSWLNWSIRRSDAVGGKSSAAVLFRECVLDMQGSTSAVWASDAAAVLRILGDTGPDINAIPGTRTLLSYHDKLEEIIRRLTLRLESTEGCSADTQDARRLVNMADKATEMTRLV